MSHIHWQLALFFPSKLFLDCREGKLGITFPRLPCLSVSGSAPRMRSTHTKFGRQRRRRHCPLAAFADWVIGISLQPTGDLPKTFWESPTIGSLAIGSSFFVTPALPDFLEGVFPTFISPVFPPCISLNFDSIKLVLSKMPKMSLTFLKKSLDPLLT